MNCPEKPSVRRLKVRSTSSRQRRLRTRRREPLSTIPALKFHVRASRNLLPSLLAGGPHLNRRSRSSFLSRTIPRLGILGLLGFLLYEGPGIAIPLKAGSEKAAFRMIPDPSAVESEDIFYPRYDSHRFETCQPIWPYDRSLLTSDAGLDLVSFVEDSTRLLHRARTPEEQLKVISARFDHGTWSKAWSNGAKMTAVDSRAREFLRLQTDLNHASLFLSRYNRIMENGKNQERAALRAFIWRSDAQRELQRDPMRVLVRGYLPHLCLKSDEARYGCVHGETIYRIHTLLSPRLACRFADKREQYAAVFWVRILKRADGSREARISEVEANGERLVKNTYDDLTRRKLLSVLAPNVTETLAIAGLDPFRVPMMWRRWVREQGRSPASHVTK